MMVAALAGMAMITVAAVPVQAVAVCGFAMCMQGEISASDPVQTYANVQVCSGGNVGVGFSMSGAYYQCPQTTYECAVANGELWGDCRSDDENDDEP